MQTQEQYHVSSAQFPSALYEHVLVKLALANLIFIVVNALKPNE
jgi:hypothetical protein